MASVTSLDQDMRNLRMSRYTPQAANEARQWIEETLREPIASGDLLDALKDGVALCKLANLVLPPPGIKFKKSQMPFMQMENISHFLKACEMPPLSMPAHDRFLTVDLYESKDPAQVLQCLGAFSRRANAARPDAVRTTMGPKKSGGGTMSPTSTGTGMNGYGGFRSPSPTKHSAAMPGSARTMSPSLTGGSTGSQGSNAKSPENVSSWSRREHESNTMPAWNIAQYGYMGGASQGNQGISFGARRQITSQAPSVPGLAEKERLRKEKAAEQERQRQQAEEAEHKRRVEREAEEEQERVDEERRWEEETKQQREEEKRRVEDQKRQWAEQERRWKEEEEVRRKEAAEINAMQKKPPEKPRVPSSGVLRGQTLSEWQREQANGKAETVTESPEQKRVRELEMQLEEARERERQYQAEREEQLRKEAERSRPSSSQTETARPQSSAQQSEASWTSDERDYLRKQWQTSQENTPAKPPTTAGGTPRDLPSETKAAPSLPSRPFPQPSVEEPPPDEEEDLPAPPPPTRAQPSASASSLPRLPSDNAMNSSPLGTPNRPLPTPDKEYTPYTPSQRLPSSNRTDRFLSTNPAPAPTTSPRISSSQEAGDTALEQSHLRDSRVASQTKTKAGGWASKSLLEREMERERERQREWEQNQQATKSATRDGNEGSGEGKSWDVNQYGYTGGDSQNSGSGPGSGISFGGRRQILGPRSMTPGGSRRG